MPTQFKIIFQAEHPLKIGTGAPTSEVVLAGIEAAIGTLGMLPVAAQVERSDEDFGTAPETKSWTANLPDAVFVEVANLFQGIIEQETDPESDLYSPDAVGQRGDGGVDLQDLVGRLLARRHEHGDAAVTS